MKAWQRLLRRVRVLLACIALVVALPSGSSRLDLAPPIAAAMSQLEAAASRPPSLSSNTAPEPDAALKAFPTAPPAQWLPPAPSLNRALDTPRIDHGRLYLSNCALPC